MTWRQRCERAPNARDFRAAWDEFRPKLVAFEELLAAVMDVANNDIANGVTDARQLATVSPGLRDPDLPSRGHRDVAPPGRQAADLQERVEVVSCTPKSISSHVTTILSQIEAVRSQIQAAYDAESSTFPEETDDNRARIHWLSGREFCIE